MSTRLLVSPVAARRVAAAKRWLEEQPPGTELIVLAATTEAARELTRLAARERDAAFGWHHGTLASLAAALAMPELAARDRTPVGALACEAVVGRALHRLADERGLGRYAPVAATPGLARAAARCFAELRLAGIGPERLEPVDPDLAALLASYVEELDAARLVDRAGVLELAAQLARDAGRRAPELDRPLLLLDPAVASAAEAELVAALAARAPSALATAPRADERGTERLAAALGTRASEASAGEGPERALEHMQERLFATKRRGKARDADDSVELLSAPGEGREAIEIARRIRELATAGVPFDRIAVLLRSPEVYRPHLEEAFGRAGIPIHLAHGSVAPDPAGRAFLALLACAAEGLSARRFAEYLSLGELPDATAAGEPPPAASSEERWVAPDAELVPASIAAALADASEAAGEPGARAAQAGGDGPVVEGTLRLPRHWEQLLVDAAVIGGRERWERRLDGLDRELALDLEELDEPDGALARRLERSRAQLAELRRFALPLLDALDALTALGTDEARWGAWLDRLAELATRALRRPERVLAVLAELAPLAPVGPVTLGELRAVLEPRLLEVSRPPEGARYGRVFVAPVESVRGLSFDTVFVPGLAEKMFPPKVTEDPLLLDARRELLSPELERNPQRVARERLALALAVGAAERRAVLSYPRLDTDAGRPRVPSFYALEALHAAEGKLESFAELAERADRGGGVRLGWPAPESPERALDAAERDLAILAGLAALPDDESRGAARYLIESNEHLGRALRFRARRWLRRWTPADGLVEASPAAREAIAAHALSARAYSPTALQHYAACPYRFLLSAVHRLQPREAPEPIEEMDPLSRGSLVHEVQFRLSTRLAEAGELPVNPTNLDATRALLEEVLDEVAARYHDDLAPAIERVWEDGIASVRADLREWLRRAAEDPSGFVPWRFELSFGLPGRRERDPHSAPEPVELESGIRLRGSIDLVERRDDGLLRVTDYKTGKARAPDGVVVGGGETLQPVLYALTLERLLPDERVASGRLYYCTHAGGFTEREVPIDTRARQALAAVADTVRHGLAEPFLPAAPREERSCEWCDYRVVCGPDEWARTRGKPGPRLAALDKLRALP